MLVVPINDESTSAMWAAPWSNWRLDHHSLTSHTRTGVKIILLNAVWWNVPLRSVLLCHRNTWINIGCCVLPSRFFISDLPLGRGWCVCCHCLTRQCYSLSKLEAFLLQREQPQISWLSVCLSINLCVVLSVWHLSDTGESMTLSFCLRSDFLPRAGPHRCEAWSE